MITTITNDNCFEFRGLSTDTKPIKVTKGGTIIGNGSIFLEMDTTKVFMYNEAAEEWIELK